MILIENSCYPMVDASPYGNGAALSQITPEKEEKPIAFISKSLALKYKLHNQAKV